MSSVKKGYFRSGECCPISQSMSGRVAGPAIHAEGADRDHSQALRSPFVPLELVQTLHQRQNIVDVMPVKYAAMYHAPAPLVVGTDDLGQITVEVYPECMQIKSAEIDVVLQFVGIKA